MAWLVATRGGKNLTAGQYRSSVLLVNPLAETLAPQPEPLTLTP
jgi:hypothetical protein